MSRQERVCMALKKEISNIIHDELKDPRLGFVTITRVELSKDLRSAKIFYSVLGKEEEYKNTKLALESGSGFIRKLIAERISLRLVPDILFREDRSGEYSIRIHEVLDEIKELNKPRDEKVKVKIRKGERHGRKRSPGVHKKK